MALHDSAKPATKAADQFAETIAPEVAALVEEARPAAAKLRGFEDGPAYDPEQLALRGNKSQLEAWRSTREPNQRFQEILTEWRRLWGRAVQRAKGGTAERLFPAGFDLHAWEHPELVDDEAVRLGGAMAPGPGGERRFKPHDVDLVAIARQPAEAGFRLLGPTAAFELLGSDGYVQPAHPLAGGSFNPALPGYDGAEPTAVVGPPPERTPHHYIETADDVARWINEQQYERERTL